MGGKSAKYDKMVFKEVYYSPRQNKRKKKELSNEDRLRRITNFKRETNNSFIDKMPNRTDYINRSISFFKKYNSNPKAILQELISENYELARHLLRKEGKNKKTREAQEKRMKLYNLILSTLKQNYPKLKNNHDYDCLAWECSRKNKNIEDFMEDKGYELLKEIKIEKTIKIKQTNPEEDFKEIMGEIII